MNREDAKIAKISLIKISWRSWRLSGSFIPVWPKPTRPG
jgi:hypothetical protein